MPTWLLDLIRCPITMETLGVATEERTERLRAELRAGKLVNRIGASLTVDFQSGLVNESSTWYYPVIDDIPMLVPDEAIAIS